MNLSRLRNILTMAIATSAIASCSMMEEDLSDCPDGLDVYFKYDYNIQRADMFADHVGAVTVYVFDEANRFVMQRTVANTAGDAPLKKRGFAMHFNSSELAPGRYSLLALAGQKDYGDMLQARGAKFRRTELTKGDDISKLMVTLDRGEISGGNLAPVEHESMPLDTLWHGLNVRTVELSQDRTVDGVIAPVKDTISLVRDTKQLNITLRQDKKDGELFVGDYDVRIIDRNGLLAYDNTPDKDDRQMLYTPYVSWETDGDAPMPANPDQIGQKAAHYELFTSRIMYHNDTPQENARLVITNRTSGRTVVDIDLAHILATGRDWFSINNYTPQEFLDREYRYNLDFFLVGTEWRYMIFTIGVLDYSMRFQNENL